MSNTELTMGEATREVQGYPTQVWAPVRPPVAARDIVALIHDRRGQPSQPGVFFLPGNRIPNLFLPGTEEYTTSDGPGNVRRLRIPNAVLWENHGGPCELDGAKYRVIAEELMSAAYRLLALQGRPVIIAGKEIDTNMDYMGPFDYMLPTAPLRRGERPKLALMDQALLRGLM